MSLKVVEATNEVWLDAAKALKSLSQNETKTTAFAFRLRRLMRVVFQREKEILEERQELITKHAKKDSSGEPIMVDEERTQLQDVKAFQKDHEAFLDAVVPLHVEPISKEELDREGIRISGAIAYGLGPLLIDPMVTDDGVEAAAEV